MGSRQDWAANLAANSGAAIGAWVVSPGGKMGFTFSGTVSDVDIEVEDVNGAAIPAASNLTTVAAAGLLVADIPPGRIRANIVTGTAVYVRAATVPE